jgi:cell division ATPase FtsA
MERHLYEGIILTGGGALLNGMCDMAERVLIASPRTASLQKTTSVAGPKN